MDQSSCSAPSTKKCHGSPVRINKFANLILVKQNSRPLLNLFLPLSKCFFPQKFKIWSFHILSWTTTCIHFFDRDFRFLFYSSANSMRYKKKQFSCCLKCFNRMNNFPACFFIFVFSIPLTVNQCSNKNLSMPGLKLRTSGVIIYHSANWATTNVQNELFLHSPTLTTESWSNNWLTFLRRGVQQQRYSW